MQAITFAVNYVGDPFNTPIRENRPMFYSLNAAGILYMTLVTDTLPSLTDTFQLVGHGAGGYDTFVLPRS